MQPAAGAAPSLQDTIAACNSSLDAATGCISEAVVQSAAIWGWPPPETCTPNHSIPAGWYHTDHQGRLKSALDSLRLPTIAAQGALFLFEHADGIEPALNGQRVPSADLCPPADACCCICITYKRTAGLAGCSIEAFAVQGQVLQRALLPANQMASKTTYEKAWAQMTPHCSRTQRCFLPSSSASRPWTSPNRCQLLSAVAAGRPHLPSAATRPPSSSPCPHQRLAVPAAALCGSARGTAASQTGFALPESPRHKVCPLTGEPCRMA